MTPSIQSATDADEKQGVQRLRAADAMLTAAQADTALLSFFRTLFKNAVPDDLVRYTPEALTTLARLVFARIGTRRDGEPLVTLFTPRIECPDYGRDEYAFVAVNKDSPFLFDSLIAALTAGGARIQAVFHPVMMLDGTPTSVIVAMLESVSPARQAKLCEAALAAFAQVREAVRDWQPMQARMAQTIAALKSRESNSAELDESIAFLEWLADNHFTFLGAREYQYDGGEIGNLAPVAQSGLGVLSNDAARVIRRGTGRIALTPQVRAFLEQPSTLIITKSSERSLVHRRVHMDYIGVKLFDAAGALTGEQRFVGLFTSSAYRAPTDEVPLLRRKIQGVLERAGLAPASHDGKALAHILETYPRDELFQISEDELYTTVIGILRLGERPKVRVFARFDRFDRFVSLLVFVPRERFDSAIREKIHALLARAFDGRSSASTLLVDDSALVRVHYIVGRNPGPRPRVDMRQLEADIAEAIRTWDDGFAEALAAAHTQEAQRPSASQVQFPPAYRSAFTPEEAVRDLDALENLSASGGDLMARIWRKEDDAYNALRLKLYVLSGVLPLSASLPVFENLGLNVIAEDAFPVALKSGDGWTREAMVLDFAMERADGGSARQEEIRTPLEDAFHAVMRGAAENDGFNRLVIGAGLGWRDVTILRAVAKFLRQAGIPFSQDYMEQALTRNPDAARMLVELFHARCRPAQEKDRAAQEALLQGRIETALAAVPSLDDDRIIRRMRNVIAHILRTNFYQPDTNGADKSVIAIKLDSPGLDELPAPRPMVEIFVYSPRMEGVHLRFGRIARGGIRWSDRREDFRTEILGLVKAQQVKNAVIVPVGAKGGFFPKALPAGATREETMAVGIAAYKDLIGALLDVTDNLDAGGKIVPPDHVRRLDGDDPYLVVAADKGTATFSDIANDLALARGFWLGDAFASGGSHGYDHKKMGITARGAWEAVQRHFREMGRNIQKEPFTVVGVGDMSGDVFGNGMLLSKQIRLLAAFDHRHIFLDPQPDAAASWAERVRLFALPRSSWADYDPARIGPGGGVFARSLKEIALSPQIRALLDIESDRLSPAALIKMLLTAPVDLLWFGGIGTFVKASTQSHGQAGDRANDALRVDGADIRAKVVGEGANLGVTQLGRIEYARKGGRINTDAVDNSAGVDTSDHEVNLKILLSLPLRRGEMDAQARDTLLHAMTDDVAAQVLADNHDQTLALSVAECHATRDLDAHGRFIADLENRNRLDRKVEFLPDKDALQVLENEGKGLTRPELAVLLAYAKLDLDAEILASTLPDDPAFETLLADYFPPAARARFPADIKQHRLRREIVATGLANRIVNLAGPVFVARMKEAAGAGGAQVARAFVVAEGAFGLNALKQRIDALDGGVAADVQTSLYGAIAEILRRLGLWFLTNVPAQADLAATIALYRSGMEELRGILRELISPFEAQEAAARIAQAMAAGTPRDIAEDVALLPLMSSGPQIAALAQARSLPVVCVAGAYFALGAITSLDRLRDLATRIASPEHWDRLAIRRLVDDLYAAQGALTASALDGLKGKTRQDGALAAQAWAAAHDEALERARGFLAALEAGGDLTIAKLTLANSQVHALAGN
jgi:glutamate dehydrogenase